jgi:hypothetical protein
MRKMRPAEAILRRAFHFLLFLLTRWARGLKADG